MACALSRRARHRRIWVELKDNSSLDRGPASHTVFPNPGVFKLQSHKRLTGLVVLTTVKMCFDSRGYNRTPHRNGSFWRNRGTEIPQIRWGRGLLTVARWQVRVGRWCVVGLGCTIQVWSWYYRPPDATRDVCLQTQPNVPCLGKTAHQPHTTLTPLWRNISGNKLVS